MALVTNLDETEEALAMNFANLKKNPKDLTSLYNCGMSNMTNPAYADI